MGNQKNQMFINVGNNITRARLNMVCVKLYKCHVDAQITFISLGDSGDILITSCKQLAKLLSFASQDDTFKTT